MTVIDSSIDCTIPCFQIFRMFNSCPTKIINYSNPFNSRDIHEIAMVLLSVSPYPTSFLLLTAGAYFRTTRSILILMMIFIQNFLVEILKNNLKDPRPNYKCNQHYGNPSNHATFFTSLITWFIMEYICLEKKFRFKYKGVILFLFAVYPFVIYSRMYLKYHSVEQIINGILLGIFVGVTWFIVGANYILANDNAIRKIFGKFNLENTLTHTVIIDDDNQENRDNKEQEIINKKYQMLLEKNNQLSKLKKDLKHLTNNVKNMDFMREGSISKEMTEEKIREMQNKEKIMNQDTNQEEQEYEEEDDEEKEDNESDDARQTGIAHGKNAEEQD